MKFWKEQSFEEDDFRIYKSNISQVTALGLSPCVEFFVFIFRFGCLFNAQYTNSVGELEWNLEKSEVQMSQFYKETKYANEQHLYKLGVTLCIFSSIVFLMKRCLL